MTQTFPTLVQTVLDTEDVRGLAEFYRELLGLDYRDGDAPPPAGEPDPLGRSWVVLRNPGGVQLAFQHADRVPRSTWPDDEVPQMLHLDLKVGDTEELERQRARVLDLGGTLVLDRSADPEEPVHVFADPAGHPFCIFVG